jgi:alpha-L-fucosidase
MNACSAFNDTDSNNWNTEPRSTCVSPNIVTWGATESGIAADPTWSTGLTFGAGDPNESTFSSRESDTTLQSEDSWFYNGVPLRNLTDLIASYEQSVGRNSLWVMDFAPNPKGKLAPDHVALYKAVGDWLRACFHGSGLIASTAAPDVRWIENATVMLTLSRRGDETQDQQQQPAMINRLVIEEDQTDGQAVRSWTVEGLERPQLRGRHDTIDSTPDFSDGGSGGGWVLLGEGTAIGNKRIVVLEGVAVTAVRLTITSAAASRVSIRRFSAHSCSVPNSD